MYYNSQLISLMVLPINLSLSLSHMRMVPTFEWCLLKLAVYDFSKYEIFFVKNSNEMKIKWKNTQERKWDKIIKLVAKNIHLWLNISKSKLCFLFHNVFVRQWWIKEFTPLKWNNWMFFMHPPPLLSLCDVNVGI